MAKNINRAKSALVKNAIPNIVGLTRTTANSLLTSLGFKYTETVQGTSSIGNDDSLVRGQDISANTVKPLDTTINATVYQFGFTPFGFTPFGFTPFAAFGFTPFSAFGFTPGSKYCVDEDTPILVVGDNDTVIEKPAKDIRIGDKVWSATFDEYIDEMKDGYKGYLYSKTLTNPRMVQCNVLGIVPSVRTETIYFNNDMSKRFSVSERILVKRNNIYQYVPSGEIYVGDYFLTRKDDGTVGEEIIKSREVIFKESRTVYRFSVDPIDHLFAGNMLVHNYK
jgi:hypothetical protein